MRTEVPIERIEEFSQRWDVSELSLFGSVLRPDFGADSDVDVLVAFEPGAAHGLFDFVRMQNELTKIFGRDVDLISRHGVESSRNPFRRKAILDSAKVIYAAAR